MMFSGMTECANTRPPLTKQPAVEATMAIGYFMRDRLPRKDLREKRFGKLTVISWAGNSQWLCKCDCGNTTKARTANLNRGNTKSCGCIRNIQSSKRATKHGYHGTPAYRTWVSVKRRCRDPKCLSYQQYGARGIDMVDEWAESPVAFIDYVGQPPSENHTLDRIDNTRGYMPGNVRWATPIEQGSNKSNNRWVTFRGERYTISQLARMIAGECGIRPAQFLSAFEHEIYGRKRKK